MPALAAASGDWGGGVASLATATRSAAFRRTSPRTGPRAVISPSLT